MLKQVRCLTKLSKTKFLKVFSQILKNVIHIELFLHSNNIKKSITLNFVVVNLIGKVYWNKVIKKI